MLNKVLTTAVIQRDLSDHFPIVFHLKASIHRFGEKRPEIQKIALEKFEFFYSHLQNGEKNKSYKKHEFLSTCQNHVCFN